MQYDRIAVPVDGAQIAVNLDDTIEVPDRPIIPFIEGDGIGVDVTPVMLALVDAAVLKAYGGRRRIARNSPSISPGCARRSDRPSTGTP